MKRRLHPCALLAVLCPCACERPASPTPPPQGPPEAKDRQGAHGSSASQPASAPALPPGPFRFRLSSENLPQRGNYKCDPVVADLNHDGLLDLAIHPRLEHGPQVWLGDGKGGWRESSHGLAFPASQMGGTTTSCGGGLWAGDVNGDGHPDLVVADHCEGIFVYLGDGTGRWELVVTRLLPKILIERYKDDREINGAEDVVVGDVNGDGLLDLVAASSDAAGVTVYLGDGSGRNWAEVDDPRPIDTMWTQRVQLADINGDKNVDIVATPARGPRVWLGDGRGGWTDASEGLPKPTLGGIFQGIDVGDVNEDGRPDLVIANFVNGPELFIQQADGSWQQSPDIFPTMLGGAFGVALGDLDRDGHLDLVTTGRLSRRVGYVYGVHVLRGDGRGGFTHVGTNLPGDGLAFSWGVTLADLNGDGVLDVVVGGGGDVPADATRSVPDIPAGVIVWITEPIEPAKQP